MTCLYDDSKTVTDILVTDYTLADDVGVIGGVSSLVGESLASGNRCS